MKDKPEEKTWAQKNWWMILILCILSIILLALVLNYLSNTRNRGDEALQKIINQY